MSIEVSNITKHFGTQKALADLSFQISTGQVVGFLGPNGAGKSTLMKVLTGFLRADSGEAKVCGLDVSREELEVKRRIGYLPEHNPLYLDMYIREYLLFVAGIYLPRADRRKKVEEVIDRTGLGPEHQKKIGALSKGFRQRVGLAQALLPDPEVLILDEPTTGLDPNQIVEVRQLIRELGQDKTVMLSTHIMQEVEAICERVIIINRGRLVADSSVDNVQHLVAGNHLITVEFLQEIQKEWLLKIEGVNNIVKQSGSSFVLDCNKDARSQLFDFAVEKGVTLLTLQAQAHNLEEIFHQVTR